MGADATIPIMSARAQVSCLRDEKNVSFELVGEEDAVAFLEERSFFFKLKAFAKDFEKYSCKPGEKGCYVNLDFGHLVELSKLDKTLRSLVLNLALDIKRHLKVRINAAAMRAGTYRSRSSTRSWRDQRRQSSPNRQRRSTRAPARVRSGWPPRRSSAATSRAAPPSSRPPTKPRWRCRKLPRDETRGTSSTRSPGWQAPRTPGPSSGSTRTGRFPSGLSSSSSPSARS